MEWVWLARKAHKGACRHAYDSASCWRCRFPDPDATAAMATPAEHGTSGAIHPCTAKTIHLCMEMYKRASYRRDGGRRAPIGRRVSARFGVVGGACRGGRSFSGQGLGRKLGDLFNLRRPAACACGANALV